MITLSLNLIRNLALPIDQEDGDSFISNCFCIKTQCLWSTVSAMLMVSGKRDGHCLLTIYAAKLIQ